MISNKNLKKSYSKNQHSFSVAEAGVNRERSSIDRPSRTISAMDGGFILPILVDEVLPGDTFQLNCELMGWLATPLKPFLDNLIISTFFFFVPNRLVWDNWQRFQGERHPDPTSSISFTIPQISILGGTTTGKNKLADYMGIPLNAEVFEVSALPFRGYNLIWNEFFRDTNLQDSVTLDTGDANSTEANHVILKRGRRKDYLSGCLTEPQKGDAVDLALGTSAPVVPTEYQTSHPAFEDAATNEYTFNQPGGSSVYDAGATIPAEELVWAEDPQLIADLSSATGATVNAFRQSVAIQQLLELDARGGTRYTEQLKARFGVTSSDQRLQRPEYLGGGTLNISLMPVPGTNQAAGGTPPGVGDLGAVGNARGGCGGFTHSFTEHGYVIGLINLRTDLTYFEGIPRHWSRLTRYDFYEPALARLGEQAVLNKEIFVSNDSTDDDVWGYQERFAEYKYGNSMVTSIMRPNALGGIPQWHLAEQFTSLPTLNATYVQDNPPIDRVIAVTSEPHILMDVYFTNRCTRVMPVFNTPGLTRL